MMIKLRQVVVREVLAGQVPNRNSMTRLRAGSPEADDALTDCERLCILHHLREPLQQTCVRQGLKVVLDIQLQIPLKSARELTGAPKCSHRAAPLPTGKADWTAATVEHRLELRAYGMMHNPIAEGGCTNDAPLRLTNHEGPKPARLPTSAQKPPVQRENLLLTLDQKRCRLPRVTRTPLGRLACLQERTETPKVCVVQALASCFSQPPICRPDSSSATETCSNPRWSRAWRACANRTNARNCASRRSARWSAKRRTDPVANRASIKCSSTSSDVNSIRFVSVWRSTLGNWLLLSNSTPIACSHASCTKGKSGPLTTSPPTRASAAVRATQRRTAPLSVRQSPGFRGGPTAFQDGCEPGPRADGC